MQRTLLISRDDDTASVDWGAELPPNLKKSWDKWKLPLSKIDGVYIPRSYTPLDFQV